MKVRRTQEAIDFLEAQEDCMPGRGLLILAEKPEGFDDCAEGSFATIATFKVRNILEDNLPVLIEGQCFLRNL